MALVDLHGAAASGDLAQLRQRWWLNKYRINGYNQDKQTPLHLACINGHADVVQFLVKKKCKLNPCDKLNKTPLMKAVEQEHRDCAAILLEHGAKHNLRDASGNTALHFAVMVCNKSLVELLLEHSADIDAKDKLGFTPLTLAITKHREEMVKFLLQKGADVNAQDNVYRTPLTVAIVSGNRKAMQLLLHHGAVFPESHKGLYPCQAFTKMVQNDVIANEQIGSSCYETTPVIPLETPELAESCDVSTEEAAEKKDNGLAADQNKVSVCPITVQLKRDVLPAAAAAGDVTKEDDDSSWGSELNSEVLDEVGATVLLPADIRRMFPGPSVAKERSKGAWQAAGAAKEEDSGSLCNSKTDTKGQGKVWASDWLPAANSNRLDARSAAVECRKGVLPAAAAAGDVTKEDDDSSWGSEPFSKIVEEVVAGEQRRAADHKGVGTRSAVAECSKAGGAGEDDDSSWDSETDSVGEWKVSAAVQLPAANSNRLDARSAAVEGSKGVLKQEWRKVKKEDRVLQPAGQEAKQEDDFPWDSETDSEGQREVSTNAQLPPADQNRVGVSSAAVEHGKAARAEQKEHFISSSENKGEDLQTKIDSSTQTDSEQDEQPLARQKLDKILKKNSLERAPLGTVKTNSRKEQKLLLETLERCKTRLKDLKEPLNKNDYYGESGKNALKESKVIKILRNVQSRLAESLDSSAAAILQLEERFQWLDRKMATLEDMIQQQAKTIEFFETIQ